ncbi:MAG: hypothetical protein K0U45_06600 [Alphaproteobacteria bacterium]|nr:hypothetical protein [Alphaproteobacteria bacterium]
MFFIKTFPYPPLILIGLALTLLQPAYGLTVQFDNHPIDFSGEMECGSFDDHSLRATFGLEFQFFRCSKIVLTAQNALTDSNQWRYKFDWAPLYDSIRREDNGDEIIYGDDSDDTNNDPQHEAQGQTAYHDWYKNLGTRNYYLGDMPLIDAYIEWVSANQKNSIRIGRQRNFIAFDSAQTIWQDDGKFAPYADWLVRDLYSGFAYNYHGNFFSGNIAMFAGNNPLKGDWYLNGVVSPNVKANNTGTYALKWGIDSETENRHLQFYLGAESNILGSTWTDNLGDGKRNNHRQVALFSYRIGTKDKHLTLLAQSTKYISGLRESSAQVNDPNIAIENKKKFQDITQQGGYGGFYYQRQKFHFGYIYEEIDRFDYHVFASDNFAFHRQGLKQKSNLYYAGYKLTDNLAINFAYHNISNPAPEASEIITHYNGVPIDYETRFKLVTQFSF